jgi:hypothetical protein
MLRVDGATPKAGPMPITLLIPTSLPQRCYLIEALMWVALNRFPLSANTMGYQSDDREVYGDIDEEGFVTGAEPLLPHETFVTAAESARANLPICPYYERLKAVENQEVPADRDSSWYEVDRRQAIWERQFAEFLQTPKAKLLSALYEGRVNADGIEIASGVLRKATDLPDFRWNGRRRPIPSGFWKPKSIDWDNCWAETVDTAYCLILVDTESVLEAFPGPPPEPFVGAVTIAGSLALQDQVQRVSTAPRLGRRPYPWQEIKAEVERRKRSGHLPPKLDSLVYDMTYWCSERFGRSPGKSTLAAKLGDFYDRP